MAKKPRAKKSAKKSCSKKCNKVQPCENRLEAKETIVLSPSQPGIFSRVYRYFFPLR